MARPRVSCRCSPIETSGQRSRTAETTRVTERGFAHPMVSPRVTHSIPQSRSRAISIRLVTSSTTRATGTSPSKLHPKAAMMKALRTGTPCARYASIMSRSAASCSALVRFWLRCRKASDAVAANNPSSFRRGAASARSNPRRLSHKPVNATFATSGRRRTTSSASAIPGTARGSTKDTTWMSRSPVPARAPMSCSLRSVGIESFSIWKPSRGPSS